MRAQLAFSIKEENASEEEMSESSLHLSVPISTGVSLNRERRVSGACA